MNLTKLLLLIYTIPAYGFFHLYTDNFACLKFKGSQVADRVSGIYEGKNEVSQFIGSMKRVAKIEEIENKDSNILLLELHNINPNINGSCGFIAMGSAPLALGNATKEITIFSAVILSYPDIRTQAYAEIAQEFNINPVYISNQQWYLDYLFIYLDSL
jgi:hypothetical protein